MVSGSISPPYSGYFSPFPHGTCSLSVSQEYLALPDGAGKFRRGFTCPALLRIPASILALPVRDYHPVPSYFPVVFQFSSYQLCRSYYPKAAVTTSVWASSRSLATTWEITLVFSSSGYLDVSVPRVYSFVFRRSGTGCPIRTSAAQWSCAPDRSFSQLTTSFIACMCLGIHHMLYFS